MNTYNLGSSSQIPQDTYKIATELLEKDNCDIAIIDVYSELFCDIKSVESSAFLISNVKQNTLAFKLSLNSKNTNLLNLFSIRLVNNNEPIFTDVNRALFYKGYVMNFDSSKVEYKANESLGKLPISNDALIHLDKTIKYLKSQSISVVICNSYQPLSSITNDEFANSVDSICKKENVPFLNLVHQHNLVFKENFYDSHHMNQNGVSVFNKQLIDTLMKMNVIKY
jgi:hypothetical protein